MHSVNPGHSFMAYNTPKPPSQSGGHNALNQPSPKPFGGSGSQRVLNRGGQAGIGSLFLNPAGS